ncbi:hypothetical protein [Nesterenkonia ebinurensis]|uniref:hypothetical protein n=1 Tax=Nesterenkonia ebinurensis TaxID=2608252 RepID=UPI001CC3DAA8|nr:hypothetical protein [Nesterenkonia ebinurensis]
MPPRNQFAVVNGGHSNAAEAAAWFGWRRMWPLAGLSAAVVILAASGILPQWPGMVHLVALPPLDLFTDLRLIIAYAPSWPVAAGALGLALMVRISLLAYLVGGLTWVNLGRAARLYGVLSIPTTIAAVVVTAASTLPNSRLFWIGIGVLAVTAVLGSALAWPRRLRIRSAFRQNWRDGLRLEIVLSYFVVVVGISALAQSADFLTLWLVPVSATAAALALWGLSRPPVSRPGVLLATVAAVVVVGAAALMWPRWSEEGAQEPPPRAGSLMIMGGIVSSSGGGTIVEIRPERLGYSCAQVYYFSYAGAGDGQPQGNAVCPITTGAPYESEHTQQPLDNQVASFAAQTEDLPRPLVVAGHSHAIWVAWEALAAGKADIDVLVMVGSLPDSPTGYPPPGENGTGRVLADLLRLAVPLGELADFEFDPVSPAALELQATPNSTREILEQQLPAEVQTLSVMTAGDLALMPGGWELNVDRNVCPVRSAHPNLPLSDAFTEEFIRFLEGQPGRDCPIWRDWGAVLALPFGAPPT